MVIGLKTVLSEIRNSDLRKAPFSIEFISCDKSRKTGGRLLRLTGAVSSGSNHNDFKHGTVTVVSGNSHPVPIHTKLIMKFNEIEVI